MEADWEFEVGGDAPVIEAFWPGFVNLRDEPGRVDEIAETQGLPGLAAALLRLNKSGSPMWTSKTDVFVPEQVDPDELSATGEEAKFLIACYIDILMRSDQAWDSTIKAEQSCRKLCAGLREIPLRCCRVDMVIRRARIAGGVGLGATIYFVACGRTSSEAKTSVEECLSAFAESIVDEP